MSRKISAMKTGW